MLPQALPFSGRGWGGYFKGQLYKTGYSTKPEERNISAMGAAHRNLDIYRKKE
jgi:hypothetical protein